MKQIIDEFFERAEEFPNKMAIICENECISYESLAIKIMTYAHFFDEVGIQKGDHIGFPMNNSIDSVAVMFACAEVGCALVPFNLTLQSEAVRSTFRNGNVKHIIAKKNFLRQMSEWDEISVEGVKICIDAEYDGCYSLPGANEARERLKTNRDGNELFILTTTSGSTGNPKPIMLSQNNKMNRARVHINHYQLSSSDVILAATPLYHSLAERLVIMPLILGATCIILPRFTPAKWLECIEKNGVTFTIAVSAQLGQVVELLSKTDKYCLKSLRCVVSSSAALENSIREKLVDVLECDFHEMYGTSEISTATDNLFEKSKKNQHSVGKCLNGVSIKIIDEEGRECEVGQVGEITCRTSLVCSGYYGMQDVFEQSCVDGYFKTGDMGYMDEEGYLYFSGRKKEVIITGGINVYPLDVESCVSAIDGVAECAAFACEDDKLGEVVGVAIVNRNDSAVTLRDVRVHCAKNLADFQQPHQIYFLSELPKNSMGKLVRAKIPEMISKQGGM